MKCCGFVFPIQLLMATSARLWNNLLGETVGAALLQPLTSRLDINTRKKYTGKSAANRCVPDGRQGVLALELL